MTNLEVLTKDTVDLDVLRSTARKDTGLYEPPPFFLPKLKKLFFQVGEHSRTFIPSLCNVLKARKNSGFAVEVVDLTDSWSVDEKDACLETELRRLVVVSALGKLYPLIPKDVDPGTIDLRRVLSVD